jgi:tRNA U34 5-methylaminomethyl-2-thiouridine-forming methyltransferase MnmC
MPREDMKQVNKQLPALEHSSMDDSRYKMVLTQDGSYTLYLAEYDEHMHSLSGAYEEAVLKHVRPSGILNRNKKNLRVLDVGFGLGYNILALIEELWENKFEGNLSVISLEKEQSLLPALRSITFNNSRNEAYSFVKQAYTNGSSRKGAMAISVLFGDARNTVRTLSSDSFDAIFFDPFSPSRNPELWSVDFFEHMFRLMNGTAILTTYSSAPQIRMALLEAGFTIGRGPSVGGKREGTMAAKTRVITPLDAGDLAALQVNSRAVPYRDGDLSGKKTSILERRKKEIRAIQSEQKKG